MTLRWLMASMLYSGMDTFTCQALSSTGTFHVANGIFPNGDCMMTLLVLFSTIMET